ncbi:MAG: putative toxin-antitoxin system toxin component, PIN family [Caldilineaceae bacterium]
MATRVFADTNVLIAGADSRSGASRAVMIMAEIGLLKLVVSRQVLDEAERNLRRKLPRSLPVLAEQLVFIDIEIVPDPDLQASAAWYTVIERKDAPILEAAMQAKVDRIVTLNTKDFTPEVAEACGIRIQTPAELVEEVRRVIDSGM